MVEPVACLCEVTRRRGDVLAVEDLSLEIGPAETVALLGPNGAGKTTTLELMLGLVRPDRGVVRVLGTEPGAAIARGAIGAMLQEGGLPARTRVAELVDLVRGLYPRPLLLGDVLVLCDLVEMAERRVEALSGGERQRVRLALAVAGGPELLVLDEPTAAMDVAARLSFWKRSADYVSGGRSLVFATHRLEEAEAVADRIVMLSHGRMVADASPEELKASIGVRARVGFFRDRVPLELVERLPAVDRVEVAQGRVTMHTFDPDRTLRALLELVPELDGLEVTGPRLEEAFLALTEGEDG